ncbi:MAG: Hsp70 family protein [Deltaproteobacteria bacterium]|nr:Hsp70 family protein [Deltaproteobacteria bacterium]
MGQARYIVGIDLGTTNSAMAYVDLGDPAEVPPIRLFPMPQLVTEGKVADQPGLPSFLYLPGEHDLPAGAVALPWEPSRNYVVGTFARDQGARVPARLISSAKSWLVHSGVDRRAPILPWGSPSEVPHLSPVEAASRYLQHMREAWDRRMSKGRREWTLAESDVVLTVPASFDEVARELTVAAAEGAGLTRLTLLEEPQAAFYSWVRSQGDLWREELSDGDTVLVCDVGGGTTDFSLIAVRGEGEGMALERIAVGDHLMLGGDNMDLALARHLERRLVKRAGELDAKQWAALVHACRQAKESLLSPAGEEKYRITLAGRGSRVIGGSLRIDLYRDEVLELVLDGFFPKVAYDAKPTRARVGLQELGLPYANDPAVTRNLSAFLERHGARPQAVLFNGGAMKASLVQDRVIETMADWFGDEPVVLESRSLDLAVGLGAATYGLVRAGKGVRIRGGTVRAYYVGVDDATSRRKRGVCLIPFGVEEGQEVQIPDRTFELITDRPVTFPLHCSTAPLGHDPGQVIDITDDVFLDLPPLHTVLSFDRGVSGQRVPVALGGRLTELGTLKLFCQARQSDHRWDLELSVREEDAKSAKNASRVAAAGPAVGDASLDVDDATLTAAADAIRAAFDYRGRSDNERSPRKLGKRLETIFEAERSSWPGAAIRVLWQPLWEMVDAREVSADHEAAWLNLAGIFLRPGFGDPLDAGRIDDLWGVFRDGIRFDDSLWSRIGWWVLWRRVSGGLERGQQLELTNKLSPALLSGAALKAAGAAGKRGGGKKGKKGKKGGKGQKGGGGDEGMNRQELAEMWRCVASLERTPVVSKEGLGDVALRNAVAGRGDFAFWALGRLGARVPLYGPLDEVVSKEKVEAWFERLLSVDWEKRKNIALAVVQLARLSSDPGRDLEEGLRQTVISRLEAIACPEALLRRVREVTVLGEAEKAQLFGDSVPTGLRLSE